MIDDSRRPSPGGGAPVRVAFVVHAMQVAGAEVLIRETIRRLGKRIEPGIVCLDRVGAIGEELAAQGVPVVCLERKPGLTPRTGLKLARALAPLRPEVVHAHQYTPFFYAALAKPLLRPARLVLTEHGRHFPDAVSSARRAVNRLALDPLADAVTACCEFSRRALTVKDGFRGSRIELVENGIDPEQYRPNLGAAERAELCESLGLPPGRRYLVHVARHHPVKDQKTLIDGFALVAPEFPGVDLVLVGDGPLRGELEARARGLGLAGRVRFAGIQPNVRDWLAVAEVFALTSVSEAASLTLLEAMATALPVVVSAVGGNLELARPGLEGLAFARGDSGELAARLRALLADPAMRQGLGRAGRARVVGVFRLDATIARYDAIYRRLAGRR